MGDLELPRAEDGLAPDRAVAGVGAAGEPLRPDLNTWARLEPLVEVGTMLADRVLRDLARAVSTSRTPTCRPARATRLDVIDARGVDRFLFMGHVERNDRGAHRSTIRIAWSGSSCSTRGSPTSPKSRPRGARRGVRPSRHVRFDSSDDFLAGHRESGLRVLRRSRRAPRGMVEREGKIVAGVPAASQLGRSTASRSSRRAQRSSVERPVLLIAASSNEHVAAPSASGGWSAEARSRSGLRTPRARDAPKALVDLVRMAG